MLTRLVFSTSLSVHLEFSISQTRLDYAAVTTSTSSGLKEKKIIVFAPISPVMREALLIRIFQELKANKSLTISYVAGQHGRRTNMGSQIDN